MDNKMTIIGSGLAGPLLAILLAKCGYSVELFEKRADPRKESISAGKSINLALSHRGIKALISAGVFEDVKPHLIPMKGRMIHQQNGDIDFQSYSINPDEYINSISRAELNRILMCAAEVTHAVNINFDEALINVDDRGLHFSTGKSIPHSGIVIGADGARSEIRRYIDSHCEIPSYAAPLGHAYKELNIPSSETDDFQLDANCLHIWPRDEFMLIALPNTDKSFTCTLFMPNQGDMSIDSLTSDEDVLMFFKTYFPDTLLLLDNFPRSYFENPTGRLVTVYTEKWHHNGLCLIGDAAHAVVPFFGQGMNASFEDCDVFIECVKNSDNDWQEIFNTYSTLRKPNTDAIAKMAIENYTEMRDSVAKPDFISRRDISNALYKEFPDQFIPRYNMVSFSSLPYSQVYERGEIQQKIISELDIDNLDLQKAERLILEKLPPLS